MAKEKIGEMLTKRKIISEATINDILIEQELSSKKFGDILTEKGLIEESALIEIIADQAGYKYINDFSGMKLVREHDDEWYWKNCCVLANDNGSIKFIYNFNNSEVNALLTSLRVRNEVEICLSSKGLIYNFLSANTKLEKIDAGNDSLAELKKAIEIAVVKKSSNIRIKKTDKSYFILVDTDEGIEIVKKFKEEEGMRIVYIIADMCDVQLKPGQSLEAKFNHKTIFGKKNIEIRVEFLPVAPKIDGNVYFEAVLRLHGTNSIFDLRSLGFDDEDINSLSEILTYGSGLVLSSGPTGAGKSTTFYALLKELAKKRLPILTIEDPVENRLDEINVTQMSVSDDFRYEQALVAMLRCEPKIILVGEIRDNETANAVLKAAQTGHLVLSTIHTQSAFSVMSRLKGMGVSLDETLDVLKLATSQRLYLPLCPDCREQIEIKSLKKIWLNSLDRIGVKDESAYMAGHGKKCDKCNGTGYLSKKAVIEVLSFRANIIDDIRTGRKAKYTTLRDKAVKLFRDGNIDIAQLFNIAG